MNFFYLYPNQHLITYRIAVKIHAKGHYNRGMHVNRVPGNQPRIESHQRQLVQAGCPVHDHRPLLHGLQQVLLRHGRVRLGCLECIDSAVAGLYQCTCYKWREHIPRHILGQTHLVQFKSAVGYHNTTPYGVHNRSEHLALECAILGRLAECPLQKPLNGLLFKLTILGLVQTYQLLPLSVYHGACFILVLVRQVLRGTHVITCIYKLSIQVVAVCYHGKSIMARNRSELRGEHRYTLQHELRWMYTNTAHTLNCHIALQCSIFLGLGRGLERCQRFLALVLNIDLLERICDGLWAFLASELLLTSENSLELLLGYLQQACNRLLHYRVQHRLIQLDITPAGTIHAEDICTKQATVHRLEALGLVGVSGFDLSVAGYLLDVAICQCKDRYTLGCLTDAHTGALQVRKELLMHQRLARNSRDLADADLTPEFCIRLPADELGICDEGIKGTVANKPDGLETAKALTALLAAGGRNALGIIGCSTTCRHLGLRHVFQLVHVLAAC